MNYPLSRREDVKETIFGVEIKDPYRWMENQDSPELAKWVDEQIAFTEDYLSKFPGREALKTRLKELYDYEKYSGYVVHYKGRLLYELNEGLNNQPVFYVMDLPKHIDANTDYTKIARRVLIDPNKLSSDGTTSISIAGKSKDGKYLCILSAESGSDWQVMNILDIETGERLPDELKNIKFTSADWDDEGFYYSGYDIPDDKRDLSSLNSQQIIFYHKLGTPQSEDRVIFTDPENPLRYIWLSNSDDKKHLLLTISAGTSGTEYRYRAASAGSDVPFKTILEGFEQSYHFIGSEGDILYFLTDKDASNMRVIAYHLDTDTVHEVIGENEFFIDGATYENGKILLQCSRNAISQMRLYDVKSGTMKEYELPGIGSVYSVSMDSEAKYAYYVFGSFLVPVHHYVLDLETGKSSILNAPRLSFDPVLYTTEHTSFKSKDGTEVPMFIVRKKDLPMDGKNPGFIYGYGGFQISISPSFSPSIIQMLEHGFVYAVVNLRGGLEKGEQWHKDGMLHNKQNVFDDMIAGSEFLIEKGYTSADRLAIHGRSNGGLLAGAVMCQRPDLYAVSLPQVGVLDMLRFHKFTVGWGWMTEYGNPDVEEDFKYILKYSPLHNIKPIKYPATLVLTADHDDRVVPAHSFKFGAEMQHTADKFSPVLLHITKGAGHGAGNAVKKVIDERSDVLAFMLANFAK
ncbi:MAG: prolyl oligopeptidase family serine peptidase [Bacillota bacterium]|nr:prolyl oligopeptidase family serine peptidase [Bacillota bacterium]